MTDTDLRKKLGPNASSFERHLSIGIDAAGLDINDFSPCYMAHSEDKNKGIGFGIMQVKKDSSSFVCCFEDSLTFPEGGSVLVIDNEQPSSAIAVLVLVSILSGRPMVSPQCPCCEEEN